MTIDYHDSDSPNIFITDLGARQLTQCTEEKRNMIWTNGAIFKSPNKLSSDQYESTGSQVHHFVCNISK